MSVRPRGCRVIVATPTTTIIECDSTEERWHESMAALCDMEARAHDLEQCVAEDMTLHDREPLFFEVRAEVDPYWPPRELDLDEVQHPEVIG